MPADVPIGCACASLRRASRAVTQLYEDALRGSGIRVTQFTLLQVLDRRGEKRQSDLDDFLALDSTTLSRSLKPLEANGWIRSRPGDDRRERYWSITKAGRAELERHKPRWAAVQQRLKEKLGDERWTAMLSELAVVAGAAQAA